MSSLFFNSWTESDVLHAIVSSAKLYTFPILDTLSENILNGLETATTLPEATRFPVVLSAAILSAVTFRGSTPFSDATETSGAAAAINARKILFMIESITLVR